MPIYSFRGKTPVVDPTAWVAPTATLIGDVVLGPHVSVWFGAVLRADMHFIRVGAYSNLQDNVVVHVTKDLYPTEIGEYVTVGHGAIVHACRVGSRCLIGMGAIVMDGAEVGDESLVAAGALVPPGMRIPPRSLVMGVPARVVRALSDEEVARIHENTLLYVEYKDVYGADGQFGR
ncbi:Carnitine operon protein CaiE [bacterium HR11]|nr:Carnitine operon protein CaiE [bacterium HR11]